MASLMIIWISLQHLFVIPSGNPSYPPTAYPSKFPSTAPSEYSSSPSSQNMTSVVPCYPQGPCDPGYMDTTNGNSNMWQCGANCVGGAYRTNTVCNCACTPQAPCTTSEPTIASPSYDQTSTPTEFPISSVYVVSTTSAMIYTPTIPPPSDPTASPSSEPNIPGEDLNTTMRGNITSVDLSCTTTADSTIANAVVATVNTDEQKVSDAITNTNLKEEWIQRGSDGSIQYEIIIAASCAAIVTIIAIVLIITLITRRQTAKKIATATNLPTAEMIVIKNVPSNSCERRDITQGKRKESPAGNGELDQLNEEEYPRQANDVSEDRISVIGHVHVTERIGNEIVRNKLDDRISVVGHIQDTNKPDSV